MNVAKANYKKKCKTRKVTFYTNSHDKALYEFSQTINFQAFVKNALENALNDAMISGKGTNKNG